MVAIAEMKQFSAYTPEDKAAFEEAYAGGMSETCKDLAEWIRLGCGDEVYVCEEKKATYNWQTTTDLPDLSEHNCYFSDVLKTPEGKKMYEELKDKKTALGVTLGQCLKTGFDNPGHPMIKTVGLVAGDEDSFVTFKALFDPVTAARHNGYDPVNSLQTNDMDASKLSTSFQTKLDAKDCDGGYILTTRCRTGRSISGFKLPPAISFTERRKLEAIIVKGLQSLTGELKGSYLPLKGSKSYGTYEICHDKALVNGMTEEQEEALRNSGNLFQEPDSTLLLSSGCGRHWPDARGIFANDDRNFFVWVNEEDQMRIVSMQKGAAITEIFTRFSNATAQVQKVLKENECDFMSNPHLGWILTCPSNLGTGLRAGTMMKVPLFSARPDFKKVLANMKLQARGTAGVDSASTGGTWDISNADRLGFSEVQLCNIFIEGATFVILAEKALEKFDGDKNAEDFPMDIEIEGTKFTTYKTALEAHLAALPKRS